MTEGQAPRTKLRATVAGYFNRRNQAVTPGRCDGCGKQVRLTGFDAREWFRAGPVPIFPLRSWRVFDRCPLCRHQRRMLLRDYRAWLRDEAAAEANELAAAPDDPERRLALAWKQSGLGHHQAALATLAAPFVAGDPPAALHHARGLIHNALEQRQEAIAALSRAAELEPGVTRYRLDLGEALLARRQTLGLAEHHLRAATEQAPHLPEAWAALARALARRGNWREAAAAWDRCRRLPDGERLSSEYQHEADQARRLGAAR